MKSFAFLSTALVLTCQISIYLCLFLRTFLHHRKTVVMSILVGEEEKNTMSLPFLFLNLKTTKEEMKK